MKPYRFVRWGVVAGVMFVMACSIGLKQDNNRRDATTVGPSPTAPQVSTEKERFRKGMEARSGVDDGQSYVSQPEFNTEDYSHIRENIFHEVRNHPLSTFSVDVDTASYSNVRRFLNQGQLPPPDAVRIEEMVNYFTYDYPQPGTGPFSINLEQGPCPWNPDHRLVLVGLQGRHIQKENLPPRNLVFLIDTSGSMNMPGKLPLLKRSFKVLVEELNAKDRIAIVAYAGSAGLVLPSTSGADRQRILEALNQLEAGGSTNGGQGIELAYRVAQQNFLKGGVNRVVLATDGDFNVGVSSEGDLVRLIEAKRNAGVFLTVLGFGMGNLKDSKMEQLADKGNGNYAYIDSFAEARKVLGEQSGGTLVTIAKDVKIQVEFNPATVAGYRLIGYENRLLRDEDFNDDTKDAGEIGAGHSVTALYEIVPAGKEVPGSRVDSLKYQKPGVAGQGGGELLTVKIRYKDPDQDTSRLLEQSLKPVDVESPGSNLRFASSVVTFGMLLRGSDFKGRADYDLAFRLANESRGSDPGGYRAEMIRLMEMARALKP